MPSRRRRTPSRSGRGTRRKLVWAQRSVSVAATANNQYLNVDLLSEYKGATGASSIGITIMRTHLWVLPHAPTAGDSIWLGLRIADLADVSAAFAASNALVSNPRDNAYVDWMFDQRYVYDVNLRVPTMHTDFAGAMVDLRAKRRMEEVQEAYVLTVVQDSVTTVAKTYDGFARTLLALP